MSYCIYLRKTTSIKVKLNKSEIQENFATKTKRMTTSISSVYPFFYISTLFSLTNRPTAKYLETRRS